jgi:hypothetical protein
MSYVYTNFLLYVSTACAVFILVVRDIPGLLDGLL